MRIKQSPYVNQLLFHNPEKTTQLGFMTAYEPSYSGIEKGIIVLIQFSLIRLGAIILYFNFFNKHYVRNKLH